MARGRIVARNTLIAEAPEGGGSDRNAESDGTRSRRRCGADPNPCPQPLPLHTDGDVCGEGVNTGRSGVALTRPGAHSSKSSSSESESERLNILGSDGAAAGLEPRKSDSSRLPRLSARALRSSACTACLRRHLPQALVQRPSQTRDGRRLLLLRDDRGHVHQELPAPGGLLQGGLTSMLLLPSPRLALL